ncbi:MAG TPA: PTS sugar transporter subunit IIA [Gaiellaceae bacterium]|nr:PTS sugar transporter subunit IIA [Gaiellaceae bacterium]
MVGIVVVGHGRLAEEMVQTLEGVLGRLDGVESVPTTYSDSPEAIRGRIEAAVRRVDTGRGVIIVTDMLGDTPTNQSLAVARDTGAEVVAGANMPILIKLTTARGEMDACTLARFIQRYGQEHIFWATAPRSGRPKSSAADADGRRD